MASIEKRLTVQPLVIQIVLGGEGKGFCDLLDLVIMQAFKWRLKNGNWGMSFTTVSRAELMTSIYNTWEVAAG